MSRHTPAGWHIVEDPAQVADSRWLWIEDDVGEGVCQVWLGAPDDDETQFIGHTNANLIQASPDLLQAAIDAEMFLSLLAATGPERPGGLKAMLALQRAIAKARGDRR